MAAPASGRKVLCRDWEALKHAIRQKEHVAYEFDRNQLHVWTGDPRRGDRCECGARTWS
jgi:hypothetical protein